MSYNDVMNTVRYWDNRIAKWILRHFYFIFFEAILAGIFIVWLVNTCGVLDISAAAKSNLTEKMLALQSNNLAIIALLALLNSFWLLYMLSGMQSLRAILKDINYNLSKLRGKTKITE
ncbi:MAG: hypothetical protein HQL23_04165 [Candidatus Omnitrophica bacterium]|nr:hypothetical protein [Candidatus Omnitrophota bacterium]